MAFRGTRAQHEKVLNKAYKKHSKLFQAAKKERSCRRQMKKLYLAGAALTVALSHEKDARDEMSGRARVLTDRFHDLQSKVWDRCVRED